MTITHSAMTEPSPKMRQSTQQAALALARTLDRDDEACLVIRHAARHPIPAGAVGADVQLTAEGEAEALLAGQRLRGRRIARVVTSPLQRCIDTGRLLTEGSGSHLVPEIDDRLGDGGLFVHDRELSRASLAERGAPSTIWQLLVSSSPPSGFRPLRDGLAEYLTWIGESLSGEGGLTIMVTHDANIAAIAGGLLGLTPLIDGWPGFLDGVLFRRDGEHLIAHYGRSQVARIPQKEAVR